MLHFFTSLDGRIGRKSFWLWTLASSAVISLALLVTMSAILSFTTDYRWINSRWFNLLLQPLLYPLFVIDVKRGHDRDFPTWAIGAYYALLVVYDVVPKFGWPQMRPDQGWLSFQNLSAEVLTLLVTIAGLYFLIELGFRKGTPGSNRFGPDPLARHFRANTAAIRPRVVERNG